MAYIELAFAVICVVAILQSVGRRLPVPMAALQIGAGVVLSAFAELEDLREQSALLFVMLVPPLLYVEARHIPKRELMRSIKPVLGMAMGLVALTTLIVGFGLHALVPEMPLAVALALAAALASTDTVAVSAVVGRMPLPTRLQTLLSGESLLNDSVALVAFKVAVAAAVSAHFSAGEAALSLLTVSVGGLATGAGVAVVTSALRRWLQSDGPDSIRVASSLSLLTAYGAYLASEMLGVSGVLAVVAAGLCAGELERSHLRATTRQHGNALWGTLGFVMNGAVFVMLGLQMRQVLHRVEGYSGWSLFGYVALLTATLFTVRWLWTLALDAWSRRKHISGDEGLLASKEAVWVTVLCGVRGSLALSATLSIPLITGAGEAMPGRDLAVFLAASTIGATLLLSGLVLPFVKMRNARETSAAAVAQRTRVAVAAVALEVINSVPLTSTSPRVRHWVVALKRLQIQRMATLGASGGDGPVDQCDLTAQHELSLRVLSAQRSALGRFQNEEGLTPSIMQELELDIDLAEIGLERLGWRTD
jgi:CPA1 family monovalent cation:H+ antiporter